jgi:hypothetical protein
MTPIFSTLPKLFPSPLIILLPNWFLWGYLFDSANVQPRFHLAYLLGLSPHLNFVASLMASGSLTSFLALLPFPSFFRVEGQKDGPILKKYVKHRI